MSTSAGELQGELDEWKNDKSFRDIQRWIQCYELWKHDTGEDEKKIQQWDGRACLEVMNLEVRTMLTTEA